MYRAIIAALTVCALVAGCTDRIGKSKEALLKEGIRLADERNPRGAIVFFKNALESDQNFFEARFHLARAYYSLGNFDSAEKELQKVTRQSPSLKDARMLLARVYLHKGKTDEALRLITEASGEQPGDTEALEITGWAHALKGDYGKAVDLLSRAVSQDGRTSLKLLLARALIQTGDDDAALERVHAALEKEPSSAEALYLLAGLQAKRADHGAAIKTYDRILKDNPHDAEAHFKKGMLFVQGKQYDQALAIANALISVLPGKPQGHALKGIALYHTKNFNEAIVSLQKSLSIAPSAAAYYFLGLGHYYRNEPEQALSQFQRTLDLNPSLVQARMLVALTLLKQKRTDDAIAEIRKVIDADKDNAFAHNILGSAYMAKGRYDEGIEEFNRALALDPKLADAHIKKGLYNISRGRNKDAESELRTAVQITPDVLDTRLVLASYYMQQKDYAKAVRTMKEGISGSKTDAVLYNYIALALMADHNHDDAVKYLRKAKEVNADYYAAYFNLASLHVAKGNHDKALEEYKAVLGRSPRDLKALISAASLLEFRGSGKEAAGYYEKARDTGSPAGCIALAHYHSRKRDRKKAVEVIDEALKTNSRSAELLEAKGDLLLADKKYGEAVRNFERMEAINPDRAFYLITNTYIAMRNYKAALEKVGGRLSSNPKSTELMAEMTRLHTLMGNTRKAEESARAIIRQRPDSVFGYTVLASVYSDRKEWDKAMDALRLGLKSERDAARTAQAHLLLAELHLKKGEHPAAIGIYDTLIKANSGNVQAVFAQGVAYCAAGRKKDAVKRYLQVIEKSPDHVPALNNLAYLYAEGYGSRTEALRLASKAYSLAPENGGVADTFGYALLLNGKTEEAGKILERAAVLLPNNPSIRYHISLVYKGKGDMAKAVENLKRAVELGDFPEAGDARLLLAELKKR